MAFRAASPVTPTFILNCYSKELDLYSGGNTLSMHIGGIVSLGLAACIVKGHCLLKKMVSTLPDLHLARLMTDKELLMISFFLGQSAGFT